MYSLKRQVNAIVILAHHASTDCGIIQIHSSLSLKKNDNNIQRLISKIIARLSVLLVCLTAFLIEKATCHTNVEEDWNLFIRICTEVNCTKGASQKARIALNKYLYAFKEPQTQYLAFSVSISFTGKFSIVTCVTYHFISSISCYEKFVPIVANLKVLNDFGVHFTTTSRPTCII